MRNREGGIDLSQTSVTPRETIPIGDKVVAGEAKVTTVSWDPNKGAQEAIKIAEEIARKQHQAELENYEADPLVRRVVELEGQVKWLLGATKNLINKMEASNAK